MPPCATKTCAVRPVLHVWWGSCRQRFQALAQKTIKQNASLGEQPEATETKVEAGGGAAPRTRMPGQSAHAESTQGVFADCWPPLFLPFLGTFSPFSPPRKVLCSVKQRAQRRAWRGVDPGWTSPQSSGRKFLPEICVKKGQHAHAHRAQDQCWCRAEDQNSRKWAKFMNFSFWPFFWFGLPGRLLNSGNVLDAYPVCLWKRALTRHPLVSGPPPLPHDYARRVFHCRGCCPRSREGCDFLLSRIDVLQEPVQKGSEREGHWEGACQFMSQRHCH